MTKSTKKGKQGSKQNQGNVNTKKAKHDEKKK